MITVTILSENTVYKPGLLAEHGFSCWIETTHGNFLFDTGLGRVLRNNAEAMDISLASVRGIILSHGHYDHTGYLPQMTTLAPSANLYAHPEAFQEKYSHKLNGDMHEISAPAFKLPENRLIATDSPMTLKGGLNITGPIPRITEFENVGGNFYLDANADQIDMLVDDQAVYFKTAKGVIVLLGCAHSGVINTLMRICELAGTPTIYGVIGGMHLHNADTNRLSETIDHLRSMKIQLISPGHCTGFAACAALFQVFPEAFVECHVGSRYIFDEAP